MATGFGNFVGSNSHYNRFMTPPPQVTEMESLANVTMTALNNLATNLQENTNTIITLLATIKEQQDKIKNLKSIVN